MSPISPPDAFDNPLDTDGDIRRRISDLVGEAGRRRLWVFLVDSLHRQLPVLLPIEGIPASPDPRFLGQLVSCVTTVLGEFAPGGSLIFVLERPGERTPHAFDDLWADGLHAASWDTVPLLGVYLAHSTGVRMMKARSGQIGRLGSHD